MVRLDADSIVWRESQILINGKLGIIILSKRQLRQGDPPLLSVFAVDTFTKMLNLADSKGLLMGIGPENHKPSIC